MIAGQRRRSLIVPREHGAWGILLVPLVTGAAVGLRSGGDFAPFPPLAIAALALFWLRTPVESWAGMAAIRARTGPEFRLVRTVALALAALSLLCLVWLFWGGRNGALIGIGAGAGLAFAAQAVMKRMSRVLRSAAQMVGAIGLTAVAPAAYAVTTGALDRTAGALWAANLLFALNQIQYVHLRIRAAQAKTAAMKFTLGRHFLAGQFLLIVALAAAAAAHLFPYLAAIAFIPMLARGFAWFVAKPTALVIHRLGKNELMHAVAFCVLLVLLWR
ncbi:MAG: YwiC-like family protein [Bryobacteraceae bacterium]